MRFLFLILVITPALGTKFHSHIRERRQNHAQPNYLGYNQAPAAIKQILAAQQARDPIVHLPPQPIPNLGPSQPIQPQYIKQTDLTQYRPKVQIGQQPQQPTYKQIPVQPAKYNPPPSAQQQYNPQPAPIQQQYNPQPAPVQQQYNPQYRTNYAPQPKPQQQVAEPNYQYSRNLPPELQQLVQIQQNLPNSIPKGQQHG
ncbi:activating signal cointegrator 1 complex subunit 2 homolog [Camponotus floridanus]|uniref:activating signal cointegrator 1 complex subunit 2 homolog n=1 Tax=Camponotus floridanus TaxID=104421 RepID=UPI000DC67031|nr:activating signal cointegrator 1 complex subunit 2 homolog [Camponotus floridanus]